MSLLTCTGAHLACTMGQSPGTFVAGPRALLTGALPAGNIGDVIPLANISPFGLCQSPSNPLVASATAAAAGVLTPMPCVPAPTGLWSPGAATLMLDHQPALTQACSLNCAWGGVISVTEAGQVAVQTA